MKAKTMKVLAALSLVLMVFSIIPSGALAEETEAVEEVAEKMFRNRMDREASYERMVENGMNRADIEKPVFETEEEEFEFLKERMLKGAEMRIERLEKAIENIEEIDNEEITEESLNEKIAEIEASIEEINDASDLEALKEIMEEMKENAPERMGKDNMERPEFETEEEEFEFLKETMLNGAEMRVKRLQNAMENIDEIDNAVMTEESIDEMIAEAQEFIEEVNNASDLDELKDIMEEHRENNPKPERDGERFAPHSRHPKFCEEEVTE